MIGCFKLAVSKHFNQWFDHLSSLGMLIYLLSVILSPTIPDKTSDYGILKNIKAKMRISFRTDYV